jgi:hypothetical protein
MVDSLRVEISRSMLALGGLHCNQSGGMGTIGHENTCASFDERTPANKLHASSNVLRPIACSADNWPQHVA